MEQSGGSEVRTGSVNLCMWLHVLVVWSHPGDPTPHPLNSTGAFRRDARELHNLSRRARSAETEGAAVSVQRLCRTRDTHRESRHPMEAGFCVGRAPGLALTRPPRCSLTRCCAVGAVGADVDVVGGVVSGCELSDEWSICELQQWQKGGNDSVL